MRRFLMVLAVAMAAATVQMAHATETLLYLNYDNDTQSVKEGADLIPYVFDGYHDLVRTDVNAGFLRLPNGTGKWVDIASSAASAIKTANEELTIEFFVKGNPETLGNWHYLVTVGGPYTGQMGVCADVNASKKLRLSVYPAGAKETSVSMIDGKWHHVAVTIKPINDGAGSHIESFVDYDAQVHNVDTTTPYLYSSGGVLCFNRSGNAGQGGCDVDEVRFTRGILDRKDFLRLEKTPPPVDGETLLYLPLDGDAKTIAHVEGQDKIEGTFTFADTTRTRTAVKEYGSDVKIRQLNLKYCAPGALSSSYNNYWALSKEKCQTCTIEFFIKGSADVTPWQVPFCYGNWTSKGNYGFLIQVNSDQTIWLKPGVGDSDTGFRIPADLTKEKWHHVALTIQPSTREGYEGGSHIEAFLDYNTPPVAANDYKNAFNGLVSGRLCFNPNGNAHCSIDEFRVTKGILPVSKFLAFDKLGLVVVIK